MPMIIESLDNKAAMIYDHITKAFNNKVCLYDLIQSGISLPKNYDDFGLIKCMYSIKLDSSISMQLITS